MVLPETQNNKGKNTRFLQSFSFALTGLKSAFKDEANMKKHAAAGLLVIILAVAFRVSAIEWLFLLLAMTLVIAIEVINTAIENVVDLASGFHFHVLAKKAKDMAAGAVLLVSGFALVVGIIIFAPKIIALITG